MDTGTGESNLTTGKLLEAYKLLGDPLPRISLVRTDTGWFKVDHGIASFRGTHPPSQPMFSTSLFGMPVWESGRVESARIRVAMLGKKKPRGRRNREAVRLVRNASPTMGELREQMLKQGILNTNNYILDQFAKGVT